MDTRHHKALSITALIVVGAGASAWSGLHLLDKDELDVALNPFGVNRSPYGQVFAMALQGPINRNFHVGMYGLSDEEINRLREQNSVKKPGSMLIVKPEPEKRGTQESVTSKDIGILDRMQLLVDSMSEGHALRTNTLPASPALKFYIRRQAEDKLRFAYDLDPSHYANYAALHFFLVEGITTRPELKAGAGKLARQTIEYCLAIDHDPRPALTAGAACTNLLHLMFTAERLNKQKQWTPDEMQAVLDTLDEAIASYHRIATQWDENGNWNRISPQRIHDCENRIRFITNIRNAAQKTIERIRRTHPN